MSSCCPRREPSGSLLPVFSISRLLACLDPRCRHELVGLAALALGAFHVATSFVHLVAFLLREDGSTLAALVIIQRHRSPPRPAGRLSNDPSQVRYPTHPYMQVLFRRKGGPDGPGAADRQRVQGLLLMPLRFATEVPLHVVVSSQGPAWPVSTPAPRPNRDAVRFGMAFACATGCRSKRA